MSRPQPHKPVGEPVIDAIVGLSDGLIIPFALVTAVSRITINNMVVAGWGFAAVVVGAIAMGLGRYYAAKGEASHDEEKERQMMMQLELSQEVVNTISQEAKQDQAEWEELSVQYGMDPAFDAKRTKASALNIALAYAAGGLIPLLPYFFRSSVADGFKMSVAVTALCLLMFGILKARYTDQNTVVAAFRYILTGATAGIAAYIVAGLFA